MCAGSLLGSVGVMKRLCSSSDGCRFRLNFLKFSAPACFSGFRTAKEKKRLLISNCKSLPLNNNNNNNYNGNLIYLFECTIVNLATYRQFTIGCLRLNCSKKNQNFIKSGLFPFLFLQQKMKYVALMAIFIIF